MSGGPEARSGAESETRPEAAPRTEAEWWVARHGVGVQMFTQVVAVLPQVVAMFATAWVMHRVVMHRVVVHRVVMHRHGAEAESDRVFWVRVFWVHV